MDTKYWVQTQGTVQADRYWERSEWMAGDQPPFLEYLEALESPVTKEAGFQATTFWIGWQNSTKYEMILDPYSLYRMGDEGIGLGMQRFSPTGEPTTYLAPQGEAVDLWVEMNGPEELLQPYLYVAFEDRSLWKSPVRTLRHLRPAQKDQMGVFLVQSVALVDLFHLVEELLVEGRFPAYFESFEAELGISTPEMGFRLAWRCQECEGIPASIMDEMSHFGWQLYPHTNGWKAHKEWPVGVPVKEAMASMLVQWPEIWSSLRHHGLAKRDLCLQLSTNSLTRCVLPPDLLQKVAGFGIQLEICG
ncbi:MAG: hypothetical protein AAF399_29180 [Bacteroidota bacterium]